MTQASFIELCTKRLGAAHVISDPAKMDFYVTDYRKRFAGKALAVVQPGNTQEVADIVRFCRRYGVPIVPQGGNTGLVLGSVPDTSGKAVVISLARMKRIRETDLANNTMTVDRPGACWTIFTRRRRMPTGCFRCHWLRPVHA